jgi:hypothetical protein
MNGLSRAVSRLVRCHQAAIEHESTPIRWGAQMLQGAAAASLVLGIVVFSATEPLPAPNVSATPRANMASVIPLLSAAGVAESAAFFRLSAVESITAEASVQSRGAKTLPLLPPVPAAIGLQAAEPPLAHDFNTPRRSWTILTAEDRAALIQLASFTPPGMPVDIILHSAEQNHLSDDAFYRYLADVRHSDGSACDLIIRPNSVAVHTASQTQRVGALDIVLVGDFRSTAPSAELLATLDEVIDFLSLRSGSVRILQHRHQGASSCLGKMFPIRQLATAVATSAN